MSKLHIVFFSCIGLGALVVLMIYLKITREEWLILSSGMLGLIGGAVGAGTAFFIAKEQIKKQDSDKVVDWKLGKYDESVSLLNKILSEMGHYAQVIDELQDSSKTVVIERIKEQKNIVKPKVMKLTEDLFKYKTALGMVDFDQDYLIEFKTDILSIFDIEYMADESTPVIAEITRINHEILNKMEEVKKVIEKIEEEIENILSN